ncbi:MAG: ParB/RepB/Spo0J family partition protein [Treponema sp.]|nr:ParB/RepB/Spo0J family partition protein [Treponema sp.]
MASKKISYNDLKKQNDNNQLAQAFSAGKTVVSQNTGFEKVKVEDITEDPKGDFTEIFPFNEEMAKSIAESMIAKGYDKTQVIHLFKIREEAETMEHPIRGDGAHRVAAAKIAGIEEIPAYIHTFETRTEALIYAYELQLNRRNLEPYQKLEAMEKLDQLKNPGKKKTDKESRGKSSEAVAEVLGVSTRTAERMRNIINNGDDETIDAVKKGEMSISKADQLINEKKNNNLKKKKNDEDLSDSVSDNSGNPAGLNFNHSDGIERPTYKLSEKEDSERTKERRTAYELGFTDGFLQAANHIFMQILHGVDNSAIYIGLFCNKHNMEYEYLRNCIGNDSAQCYEYNEFRKKLFEERPKLKDLNPMSLKDLSTEEQDEDEDAQYLDFDEEKQNEESEEKDIDSETENSSETESSSSEEGFDIF